jgi:peptidoglycan/xylan/chitin deacetylase (PgdA/CDA1 family)
MRFYKPLLHKIFFPEAITTLDKGIYITIDDSPSRNTEKVLDLLDELGIKATFFSVAKNVLRYPKLQEGILERGHGVGIHSFFHKSAFRVSKEFYLHDLRLASKIINSCLFRPPYGHLTTGIYSELKKHFKIILWSYMTYDFQGFEKIFESKIKNGSIIVLHDNPDYYDTFERQIVQIKMIAESKKIPFFTLSNLCTNK